MTNDDIKIENFTKKTDEAAKKLTKFEKTLGSSYEILSKYVTNQKDQNGLTKLFIRQKVDEIKSLKDRYGKNSPVFKLQARQIGAQIIWTFI